MAKPNSAEPDESVQAAKPDRLLSLDAYRGLIMCTLAVHGFALAETAKKLGYGPNAQITTWTGWIWQTLAFHNSHPFWTSQFWVVGCSYWDLIQPSFMFMVGVAMPYSFARRKKHGDSSLRMTSHAAIRSVVLIAIGVFLQTRRTWFDTPNLFTNVLAQIGLGYFFVFLLLGRGVKVQLAAFALILVGYTAWMLTYPVSDQLSEKAIATQSDLAVPQTIANQFTYLTNAAAEADQNFLNALLRPDKPIPKHKAGYSTFNFIPSMATMLLGVLAAGLLRSEHTESEKLRHLFVGGATCMALALVASFTVCPIIKKIWTPAWVLFSGAYVLWILGTLYWIIDVKGYRKWTFPLVVVGMNSLAIYLMSSMMKPWISGRITHYFGKEIFQGDFGPMWQATFVFAVLWLICLYLYRQKIFFRV